jgi:type I restriction enzyme M protein
VLLPDRAASSQRRQEAEIRRRIIEADLVECIVALPEQLFNSTQIPVTMWFLNRDKIPDAAGSRRDRRGETLFIDARKLGVAVDRTHRRLTARCLTGHLTPNELAPI